MISLIETGGTPFEIGFDVGRGARDQIAYAVEATFEDFAGYGDPDPAGRIQPFVDITLAAAPELVDELRGMAEGSGFSFAELFVLNASAELHQQKGRFTECTVTGITQTGTRDGSVLMAHNEDGAPGWADLTYVVKAEPACKPTFAAFTYGGLLLHQGINSNGLGSVGNALYARDAGVGIPKLLLYRKVLDQRTIEGAIRAVTDSRRANGNNHLIGNNSGDIYDVEVTGCKWRMASAGNGFLVHANHLVHPDLARLDEDDDLLNSRLRQDRLQRLIDGSWGAITPEILRSMMADHASYPKSICKHVDPEINPDVATIGSVVIDLTHRELWACAGNPCSAEWRHVSLA